MPSVTTSTATSVPTPYQPYFFSRSTSSLMRAITPLRGAATARVRRRWAGGREKKKKKEKAKQSAISPPKERESIPCDSGRLTERADLAAAAVERMSIFLPRRMTSYAHIGRLTTAACFSTTYAFVKRPKRWVSNSKFWLSKSAKQSRFTLLSTF